jgi:aspartyl-tRNA(Asn)/glutamyl-tRNA(Gln) amidotransferase subunit B
MTQIKVGLEIHGYIDEDVKLFCNCAIDETAEPNTNICPVCTGQPGSKAKATNKNSLRKAIEIALMLGCTVNSTLLFQRKHYSWPDSPNNYQRTMSGSYAVPVGVEGLFEGIRITQVHLEEDPARWEPTTGKIDYNRAGTSLIEIVTEPDFVSSEQVGEWLKKLVTTLSYIKAINRHAGIKSDVNVSIAPKFERVEIKNVNSRSAIMESIISETARQEKEKASGNRIPMQTRTWDDVQSQTVFMRSKEEAAEYMFIPDPDIPSITTPQSEIDKLRDALPEAPSVKIQKLITKGLSEEDARVLAEQYPLIVLFEKLSADVSLQTLVTYLRRELVRIANYNKLEVDELVLDEKQLHTLFIMLDKKELTDNVVKKILEKLLLKSFDVQEYVKKEGLASVGSSDELTGFCQEAIDANPKAVSDYKAGEENSLNFLVGQVMRKTRGAAKPDVVIEVIKSLL